MPRSLHPWKKLKATTFYKLYKPAQNILAGMPELKARGDRPLQLEFEHQLKALIFFHLEEHTSAQHSWFGDLIAIDGSLIDAVLSMYWADYRNGSKKAKAHLGFDINRSIPKKISLTDGKGDERSFVSRILSSGQTGVMDRGYQCHADFDRLQEENKFNVCRIKASTNKTCLKQNAT